MKDGSACKFLKGKYERKDWSALGDDFRTLVVDEQIQVS
jgi:hypothetical protein